MKVFKMIESFDWMTGRTIAVCANIKIGKAVCLEKMNRASYRQAKKILKVKFVDSILTSLRKQAYKDLRIK
jgi:hypothetical protein